MPKQCPCKIVFALVLSSLLMLLPVDTSGQSTSPLPSVNFPDKKIEEVYQGNWKNTLKPCQVPESASATTAHDANTEPLRPWKVDVSGHYPGWYPGVDVKHSAAAYLACEKNLLLVIRAWELTKTRYLLEDGNVRPMTFYNNPHSIVPETTVDGAVVYYPLRITANIDFILLGDMIFRFSQDRDWLTENLPVMRLAASFLEGWIDDEGLLHSDSYDLDQVYRSIDGAAQAAACFAFRKLADLEAVVGNQSGQNSAVAVAQRLAEGVDKHFWSEEVGYYYEHLAYNNIAESDRGGSISGGSSDLDSDHPATKAIDGIIGIGIDAFGVGTGEAGNHEWVAKEETVGAWIQISLEQPTLVDKVLLVNRTAPGTQSGERFASGLLEFSDGSPSVEVEFNDLDISRAVVSFASRKVTWVKFTGTRMQGEGGGSGGLAEFMVLPAEDHYRKVTHGMTDTNLAMLAYGVGLPSRVAQVWEYFKAHESSFYEVNGLHAPTWIAEKAETYGPGDLNRRAPYKDCVAMARIWRYDALMRHRMRDGEGLYRTIEYANALYDRPSGGGTGFFAERYGLGRFQPGDEAQATIPKYAGYPAIYNSTIIQQALMGMDVDVWGSISIDPCVPLDWYEKGFGQEGCGILRDLEIAFQYSADSIEGWLKGLKGDQKIRLRLPPGIGKDSCRVLSQQEEIPHRQAGDFVTFDLTLRGRPRTTFSVMKE